MNRRKFITDVGSSLARYTVTFTRGVLLIPLIVRIMGIESYGVWVGVLGVSSILSTLGTLNLGSALVRYAPSADTSERVLVETLVLAVAATTLLAAGYVAVGLSASWLIGDVGTDIILASGSYIIANGFRQLTQSYLRALDRIKLHESVTTLKTLSDIGGLVLAFGVFRSVAVGFLALSAVSVLIGFTVLFAFLPGHRVRPRMAPLERYLRFSLPLVPQTLSSRLIRNGDRYLVLVFVGPTAAGIYSVASVAGKMLEDISKTINPALLPAVVREWDAGNWDSLRELYNRVLRWYVLFAVPALAGIAVLAGDIIAVLISAPTTRSVESYVLTMGVAYVISGFNTPFGAVFQADEKTRDFGMLYAGAAVLNVFGNLLLIPLYGVAAAVATTALTYLIVTGQMYRLAARLFTFRFPWAALVHAAVGSALMVAVLHVVPTPAASLYRLVFVPAVGVLAYTCSLLAMGALTEDEKHYLRSIAAYIDG